jgi:hypothetical protein
MHDSFTLTMTYDYEIEVWVISFTKQFPDPNEQKLESYERLFMSLKKN